MRGWLTFQIPSWISNIFEFMAHPQEGKRWIHFWVLRVQNQLPTMCYGMQEKQMYIVMWNGGAGILDVIPEGLSASLLQHVLGSKSWRNGQGDSSRVSSRGSNLAQILQTSSSQCESFFFFFLSFFCLHESAGRMSLSPISFPAGSPKCNDEPAVGAAVLFWKDSEDSIVMEVLEVRQQQMSSFGSNDVEIWGRGVWL